MSAGDYPTYVWYDDLGRRRTTMMDTSDADRKKFDIQFKEAARANNITANPNTATKQPSYLDLSKQLEDYANSDFAKSLIGDDFDDNLINTTATTQGSGMLGNLARQRANGVLTSSGFNAAMDNYYKQFGQATTDIGGVSSGLLAGGRQSLSDILGQARKDLDDAYTNKTLGSWNLDNYKTQIGQKAQSFKDSFADSLTGAINGTQYFNQAPATQAAGAAQGVVNRPSSSLLQAVENNRASTQGRGLGNGGVF